MPITYSLIARGSIVLTEAYVRRGNFTDIARKILFKVPPTADKKSYGYEGYVNYLKNQLLLAKWHLIDQYY